MDTGGQVVMSSNAAYYGVFCCKMTEMSTKFINSFSYSAGVCHNFEITANHATKLE